MAVQEEVVSSPAGAYHGYLKRDVPKEDAELTHVGSGTAMGEYLRRFWQPVCMSEDLVDLPRAIRIMGEDLVAFRDKSGQVGVLHRHCSHRGTSLEYGIVAERGLRCCYHGWLFDAEGTILETPGEPPDSKLKDSIRHGAYPAQEERGLVFIYMGPPELQPEFPAFDGYDLWDTRFKSFEVTIPCNWLQVTDNYVDPIHSMFLHSSYASIQLTESFLLKPFCRYLETPDGSGICHNTTRRTTDELVWTRINHAMTPNIGELGSAWENGLAPVHFRRVYATRWTVPIDDTNTVMFGWRHLNEFIDPWGTTDESQIGKNMVDFDAQVARSSYEAGQRDPGDWEAFVSQRSIAIHAKENLGSTDTGVQARRRMLRQALRGERPDLMPGGESKDGRPVRSFSQDTVLKISKRPDPEADWELLGEVGQRVHDAIAAADHLLGQERQDFVEKRLSEIEAEFRN